MLLDLTNLSVKQLALLNKVSIEIHNDFNNLVENILDSTPKKVADLVGNIVSRNPYQSTLYNICVSIKFVKQYIGNDTEITQIYTNDYDIYKILSSSESKYEIKLIGKNKLICKIKPYIWPFIDLVRNFISTKRYILSKSVSRKLSVLSLKSIILIDTFLLQNSINEKKFIDRYYTGILNFTDIDVKDKLFFLPHIIGKYSKKDVHNLYQNSEENLIFKNDFLKLSDYLNSIKSLFQQEIDKDKRFYFHGFNLTKLIKMSIIQERFNCSTFEALLNYYFIKRLKDAKIDIDLFIDWNENQPIDKGIIKGIHDFYPNVKVKGYRAFIISYDYNLYLRPTQYEVDNRVIPDEIVVISESLKNEVKKYCNNIKVSLGPAFRFMDIHEPFEIHQTNRENILIILPIGLKDSIKIIKAFINAEKDIKLSKFNVLIKPHPTMIVDKLKGVFTNNWKSNYSWVYGDFKESIIRSKLFISNTSSAIVEALAYGVPGIIMGSDTSITQNPIPKSINKEIWRLVYTAGELAEAINHYTNLTDKEMRNLNKIGKNIKSDYFIPITKETVKVFLS